MNKKQVIDCFLKLGFKRENNGQLLRALVSSESVYLAENKSFDRWANSKNFKIDIESLNGEKDLIQRIKLARKIVGSKVFNFNSYFHTIEL